MSPIGSDNVQCVKTDVSNYLRLHTFLKLFLLENEIKIPLRNIKADN